PSGYDSEGVSPRHGGATGARFFVAAPGISLRDDDQGCALGSGRRAACHRRPERHRRAGGYVGRGKESGDHSGGLGTNGEGCGVLGGNRRIARLSRGRNTEHGSDQYSADPSAAQRLRSQRSGPGQRCDFSSGGHSAVASGVDYTVTGSEGRDARRKPAPGRASLLRLSNGSLPGGRGRVILGASARGFKETSVQG